MWYFDVPNTCILISVTEISLIGVLMKTIFMNDPNAPYGIYIYIYIYIYMHSAHLKNKNNFRRIGFTDIQPVQRSGLLLLRASHLIFTL